MNFLKKILANNTILLILLIFLIPELYFINSHQGYWWDEAVYLGLGKSIPTGKYYINAYDESSRPPLFPFLVSLILPFGESAVRFMVVLFGAISIYATYLLSKRIFGKRVALLSSIFIATSHYFLFFSQKILTESLFFLLFAVSFYLFYLGFEKSKKYFLLCGIFSSLCFLTRYPGILLILIFAFIVFLNRKKVYKETILYLIGASILFILILIPWFLNNIYIYKNPVGALYDHFSKVTVIWYPWYFYLRHGIEAFGFSAFFMIPGFIYLIAKRNSWYRTLLVSAIFIFLFLSFAVGQKAIRYIIPFFPFYILMAVGVDELGKWLNRQRAVTVFAMLFVVFNFIAGIQLINDDLLVGKATVDASFYIKNLTSVDSYVFADIYSVVHYISNRKALILPENEEVFYEKKAIYNISYIIIDVNKMYPKYLDNVTKIFVAEFFDPKEHVVIYNLSA